MSKNAKLQRARIFGTSAKPAIGPLREKHMRHIRNFFKATWGLKSRVTKGKFNKAGKFILKPDWTKGVLEYEPNPDAAVHEFAHLVLAPALTPLAQVQRDMDAQFGYLISEYGYMQQKRSYFEILPMGMEQKLRRRLGLPATVVKVKAGRKPRVALETGLPCAVKVGRFELIRSARNLDAGCLERLSMIDSGELVWTSKGWVEGTSIDAKINRRARLKGAA